MSKRPTRRWLVPTALILLVLVGASWLLIEVTPLGHAAWNVATYRVRATWRRWFGGPGSDLESGAIAGTVRAADGTPLEGATALVSTVTGVVYESRSDALGAYRIEGVPPGRYVVAATQWGYEDGVYHEGEERTTITVRPDGLTAGIDIRLRERTPWRPVLDELPILGPPQPAYSLFPAEIEVRRTPITYTHEGFLISNSMLYQPLTITEPLPVFVAVYPAPPLNWDRASVAFTGEGYIVLAVGPNTQRGIDTAGMARDVLHLVAHLRAGNLTPHADTGREGWLAGSFGSLIFYQVLLLEPGGIDAAVLVGGISDGFLGVQALYEVDLYIPPEYQAAIASLDPPDRYPDFYLGHSVAWDAAHMPPTMVIHTKGDEVVPYNQSERLAAALAQAGVPHELFLYEDTTHYLDQVNITPDTAELYDRLAAFLDHRVRQGE